jgi:hypothetical protein
MNKMKTIKILVAVVLMLITNNAMTAANETDNRERLKFGLKAGLNYANVYDSQSEEFHADAKLGFAGGAFISIPISKYLGLQPEILYSRKGFKGSGVILGNEYSFTRTTSYIDIPLQLALKPSEFLTFVAGPQYSYLLSQKDEFKSTSFSHVQEEEFDNDNIRKNIFGFVLGLDINMKHIILGTRVGWDITENHGDGSSTTPRYKNRWVQATIGYAF